MTTANFLTQSDQSNLPSLEELKKASYEKTRTPASPNTVAYADLISVIALCKAYAGGTKLMPRFHEPVLTRGAIGISVFKMAAPSVVLVLTGNFAEDQPSDLGIGTGVVIDPAGYVLTNWHVVAGYQSGVIFFKPSFGTAISQNSAYVAHLVAQDPITDLALLRIIKPPAGIHPIPLGDMSSAQVAEDIHIIGHPHGNPWSYSTGVISQIREGFSWSYSDGSQHRARVLQMQTAINPGNSGGPVLDDTGKMLGLVAMSEEGQNLNYAVAVDVIKGFLSRTLQAKARGESPQITTPQAEYFAARLQDGRTVTRAVYPDLVTYAVDDKKGQPIGLVVETSNGTTMQAWSPNAFGGFNRWSVRLPTGQSVSGQGSGEIPDSFETSRSEPR